ncbi:MAG: hypothetical protein ACC682_06900, partial [Gemmatimonadota bacterium]
MSYAKFARIDARLALRLGALGVGGMLLFGACQGESIIGPPPPPPPPPVLPEEELTFLRQAPDAPALLTTDTTLIATRGEEFQLRIFYEPEPGSGSATGERFLELEWDEDSLLQYPPGHPMAG